MAVSKKRWNQGLFPIDDSLIEQLIDEYHLGAEDAEDDDAVADDPFDAAADPDADEVLDFSDGAFAALDDDDRVESVGFDLPSDDEVYAVNMRVLDDYLRRRLIDAPPPAAPTLH